MTENKLNIQEFIDAQSLDTSAPLSATLRSGTVTASPHHCITASLHHRNTKYKQ